MRKARYRGRRKTRFQAFLAATVANFKRLAVIGVLQAKLTIAVGVGPGKGLCPNRLPRWPLSRLSSPHSRLPAPRS